MPWGHRQDLDTSDHRVHHPSPLPPTDSAIVHRSWERPDSATEARGNHHIRQTTFDIITNLFTFVCFVH